MIGDRILPASPRDRQGWPWGSGTACGRSGRGRGAAHSPPTIGWPRLTIIIPSLGQAEFLEEALRSALLQDYPEFEVFVSDGGSGQATVGLLERYSEHLQGWWSEPDRGQSHAVNKALLPATGDLFTFIGADDVFLPGAFHEVGRLFAQCPESGGVSGAFGFIDAASRREGSFIVPRLPPEAGGGPVDLSLADPGSWRIHQVSTFFSRRAVEEVGGTLCEDLRYTMDRELLYRVCRRHPLVLTSKPLALFRRHGNNKSSAEVAPFCREMATLPMRLAEAGEAAPLRRRRRALRRYWLARGHLKTAARSGFATASRSLVKALRHRPSLLADRGYAGLWIDTLGLRPLRERIRGAR